MPRREHADQRADHRHLSTGFRRYKEKIEEKIEEVDTDPGQNEETQPADPPEETTEVSIGHVVAVKDRIFYWKYSSQSYENAGALASFGSGWIASNQLVCRTADGTEQILLESAPREIPMSPTAEHWGSAAENSFLICLMQTVPTAEKPFYAPTIWKPVKP